MLLQNNLVRGLNSSTSRIHLLESSVLAQKAFSILYDFLKFPATPKTHLGDFILQTGNPVLHFCTYVCRLKCKLNYSYTQNFVN